MAWIFQYVACAFLVIVVGSAPVRAENVTIFAASSLKTALDQIAQDVLAEDGIDATISYAASSALAWQVERGAPADIVIMANTAWMDHLAAVDRIEPGSRTDLLGNRLVLVASKGAEDSPPQNIAPKDIPEASRLAIALVDAVPAGIYGKAALQRLDLWKALSPRVVQTDNVRAALRLVATGEVPFGVVYATDAKAEQSVRVVYRFDEAAHGPIRYPMAIVADRKTPAAQAAWDRLTGARAAAIFEGQGFAFLPVDGS